MSQELSPIKGSGLLFYMGIVIIILGIAFGSIKKTVLEEAKPSKGSQQSSTPKDSLLSLPLCGGKTLDFSDAKVPGEVEVKFYKECRTRVKIPARTETTFEPSAMVKIKFLGGEEWVDGPDMDNLHRKEQERTFTVTGTENFGTLRILLHKKLD